MEYRLVTINRVHYLGNVVVILTIYVGFIVIAGAVGATRKDRILLIIPAVIVIAIVAFGNVLVLVHVKLFHH